MDDLVMRLRATDREFVTRERMEAATRIEALEAENARLFEMMDCLGRIIDSGVSAKAIRGAFNTARRQYANPARAALKDT